MFANLTEVSILSNLGLFKNAEADSLIIDSSTISPTVAMALNGAAQKYKMTYVDAPVSGGVTGAAAGSLTFMVGA
jgi:3-hydroxyisobutyrate dehydrogenase